MTGGNRTHPHPQEVSSDADLADTTRTPRAESAYECTGNRFKPVATSTTFDQQYSNLYFTRCARVPAGQPHGATVVARDRLTKRRCSTVGSPS